MVWKEVLEILRNNGLRVTDSQVRWAIQTNKVTRPALDAGLRFVFTESHVEELRRLFANRETQ